MTSREHWLHGWFAGMLLGAAIGAAAALLWVSRADTGAHGRAPATATLTAEDRVRVADSLAAGRAYLSLGNLDSARAIYAIVLQIDCGNPEARRGLLAATRDAPFEREQIHSRIQRACDRRI